MARPAKALISKSALRHNFKVAQQLAPNSNNVAIIKANAYGHGAVVVAQILEQDVQAFGVACIEEALELRVAGINKPILLLEGFFSQEEVAIADKMNFWTMVENQQQLDWILTAQCSNSLKVWLKVDTGMHRLGVQPAEVESFYQQLHSSNNVDKAIVLTTHFASADESDSPSTKKQINLFTDIKQSLKASLNLGEDIVTSMANSAGILAWPQAHCDWNRPGFMLYGNSPLDRNTSNGDMLKPVMTLLSEIISLREVKSGEQVGYGGNWTAKRDSKIATVAIGYGDGYPRIAKNGTPTLVNGSVAPLAGRVSMDMITIDVTDIFDVKIGDEVTLWGNSLPVNEVAEHASTIGYEALTRMPLRTKRIIVD
ncbi:alanine racemase [Thalassomonas sp. M1454]|uniref:alanine racemase n=1 Tax=Thalassomonas sp. M1454 TaxID=2594477 RepID=UPI00117FD065|nr:alanine racemase [Thalassomonas sp. M1454]TRX56876.1 alanine racemase [Thalassomonas sp. M1454]